MLLVMGWVWRKNEDKKSPPCGGRSAKMWTFLHQTQNSPTVATAMGIIVSNKISCSGLSITFVISILWQAFQLVLFGPESFQLLLGRGIVLP